MEAVQKDYWYFLVLATFLIFFKDTLQKGPAVKLEDGMVLACQCPWTGNLSMVSWTKPPDREPIAVYHPEYGVVLGPQYKGRIKFIRATPLDGSISVSNVTEQDISVYHCSIQTFPKGSWTKDVHVKNIVEIGSFKPKAEVTTLEGDDAVLTCTSMHNGTISHISIEKMSTEGSGLVASCKVEDGRLEGEGFVERAHVNCTDATTASLQLTDVVEGDEGLYQCHFNTDAGIQTTTILLTVHTAVKAATYKPDVVVSVLEGDSVMLEFTHMHTGAVDHISIEKMGEGGRDLIAACTVENGTLVGEEYTGRANVECGNLVLLHLTNVVQADEGLYWCHFSTDDAVHTATIVLTVHSTEDSQQLMYIYIGGGIAGLLLIAMTFILTWWHRRKKRREQYRLKLHPMMRWRSNHEQGGLYDRMKKGTKLRKDDAVYANIHTIQQHKRKR